MTGLKEWPNEDLIIFAGSPDDQNRGAASVELLSRLRDRDRLMEREAEITKMLGVVDGG